MLHLWSKSANDPLRDCKEEDETLEQLVLPESQGTRNISGEEFLSDLRWRDRDSLLINNGDITGRRLPTCRIFLRKLLIHNLNILLKIICQKNLPNIGCKINNKKQHCNRFPDKTNLLLLTRRYKILSFKLPRHKLVLSWETKYFGVISKLSHENE